MNDDLNKLISKLKSFREKHFELGKRVIEADDGALYPLDLLIIASLNRSVSLIKGFASLIEQKNFISAAPLLRLQLDNCLRLSACTLVSNPHEFAVRIFEGERVNNMKDRNGKKMGDGYLAKKMSDDYPWILDVAENKFETNYAQLSLITNAFDSFSQIMESTTNLYLKGGGLIAETASGSFSPSNLCVFINYEEKVTDVHNINDFSLESSDPTIFEEVKNDN